MIWRTQRFSILNLSWFETKQKASHSLKTKVPPFEIYFWFAFVILEFAKPMNRSFSREYNQASYTSLEMWNEMTITAISSINCYVMTMTREVRLSIELIKIELNINWSLISCQWQRFDESIISPMIICVLYFVCPTKLFMNLSTIFLLTFRVYKRWNFYRTIEKKL